MDQERVRFWQGFSLALGVALAAAVGSSAYTAFAQPSQRPKFEEIDVERVNIVEADGTVKLVIANRNRAPDQVFDGQSRPRAANNKSPGITFFDDAGDEAGGLKVRGDRRAGSSARRHLLFDYHRGGEAIQLVAEENERGRSAGLTIRDYPITPALERQRRYDEILKMPSGPEQTKLAMAFDAEGGLGRNRAFIGKEIDRDAVLSLADGNGRARLRLVVAADGAARIEFLDASGKPTRTIP